MAAMESFKIGRTISRTTELVLQSLPTAGLYLLLLQFVSVAIQFVARPQLAAVIQANLAPGDSTAGLAMFGSGWYWILLASSTVLGSISYAGALGAILKNARDEPTSLADCLTMGLAKALPVFGLTVLWGIGVGFGMMVLLVPGIILMLMWAVSMPALVEEQIGVMASFGRSRALTKGSRWSIFVVLLVVVVGLYVALFAMLGTIIGVNSTSLAVTAAFTPTVLVFSLFTGFAFSLVISALLVSIYIETLAVRGQASSEKLMAVFK
jgi:hypothetical protein